MLESTLMELESRTRERVQSAATAETLEQVRIDALGRKGALAEN
jgi:hypothetical protein